MAMTTWGDFAAAEPELAAFVAERLRAAPSYLATVRASGAPRVHPVTPIFTADGLYLFMEPTSPKGADLRERGWFALHNGVPDNTGTGGEASVSGTGHPVDDAAVRATVVAAASYEPRRPLRAVRAATDRGALQRLRRRHAARASTVARRPDRTDGDTMSKATTTDTQSPALHAADSHDLIRVHGARVNNLKDVSVEIPKRRLTVFTGVSGSGKSSLVFGTIAAESQRLINETYSAFVQGFMPTLARPDVDVLDGLTTAILVDQERMGADPRSTVGTATDANAMLRILFSRLGKPHIGSPQAFSFNVASISGAGAVTFEKGGKTTREKRTLHASPAACARAARAWGSVTDFDLSQLYDDSKSLNEGALTIPGYSMDGWYGRIFRGCGFFDPDKPIRKFTKKELDDLLYKEPTKIKVDGINLTYAGLIPQIQKSFLSKDVDAMQPHIRAFVERVVTFTTCPDCGGTRLNEAARSSKIEGINIADACAMQISDLAEWVRGLDEPSVAPLLGVAAAHPRLVRRDRAGLPLARPAVGHAVGRRGAAHQDDPPPRVVAHRRHLRVRRADDRAAPARHRSG